MPKHSSGFDQHRPALVLGEEVLKNHPKRMQFNAVAARLANDQRAVHPQAQLFNRHQARSRQITIISKQFIEIEPAIVLNCASGPGAALLWIAGGGL